MVIRTPDQRLRVFVSSTVGEADELAKERRAVSRAISALRLTPVLIELGARPPDAGGRPGLPGPPTPFRAVAEPQGQASRERPCPLPYRMSGTVRLGNPGAGEGEEVP
jgi:hypothetical protein